MIIFLRGSRGLMCFIWSHNTAIRLSLSHPHGLKRERETERETERERQREGDREKGRQRERGGGLNIYETLFSIVFITFLHKHSISLYNGSRYIKS